MNVVTCSLTSSEGYMYTNNYIGIQINGLTLEDVMNKALTFDFNKYKKEEEQTFESKFMERTANELGNIINPATAEVIILQFRKFMAVMAYNLMIETYSASQPEFIIERGILGLNTFVCLII